MNATDVQLAQAVQRTPEEILDRYRRSKDWRLYEKEWIFHNIPPAGKTWIDFGCGTGEIVTQLAALGAARVIGVDVTPGLVEQTRRRAQLDGVTERVELFCGDFTDFRPERVDVVLAYAVLHHLPDRLDELMACVRNWLKPRGRFVCVEPVCHVKAIEWLRQRSGVPHDPLDPGERKLVRADLLKIERAFPRSRRIAFHGLARFARVWRSADRMLRQADSILLRAPGLAALGGRVVIVAEND